MVIAQAAGRPLVTEFRSIADALGRSALVGAIAGVGAGAVGGALGRLAMRVSGATSESFLVTENGNIVGRITFGGSAFLVVAGAIVGLVLGLSYVAVRRWLPSALWPRRLSAAVLTLAAFGSVLVNADNPDFTRLGEPVLNVALFVGLLLVTGIVLAMLTDWLDPRIRPRPADPWFYASVYLLVTLVSVIFGLVAVALAALPFVVLGARALGRRVGVEASLTRGSPAWRLGRMALVGAAAVGLVLFGIEVSEILAVA